MKKINFNNKGFAISGILYPVLILSIFLILQVLFLMQTRKKMLDANKKQLIEAINTENRVLTNEELTTVVKDIQSTLLNKTYPVGSIYISINSANPSSTMGGTWVAYGSGRTIVGVDTNQGEFNTVEKTGGEKAHTLSIAEMPNHNHLSIENGWSTAVFQSNALSFGGTYGMWYDSNGSYTGKTGGSGAHNNLQPYITVYMWKRTV